MRDATATLTFTRRSAQHGLDRCDHLISLVTSDDLLSARLAPGMFPLADQITIAAGFCLRAVCPLLGQAVPDLPAATTVAHMRDRLAKARAVLADLPDGTVQEFIEHRAGFADVTQTAQDYVTTFAVPNIWFHLSMAYAILRANRVAIGKADFDGIHGYPDGFQFDP